MKELRIIETPKKFRPITTTINPPHQGINPLIEERFFDFVKNNKVYSDYIYLPIFWTQYHINNNYGKSLFEINEYIETIKLKYKNEKLFTIVQYDGGTLVPIDNCMIFGCCGDFNSPLGNNSFYEPIPLLSEKHRSFLPFRKKTLASFVGNPNTHIIRQEIISKYHEDPDFIFKIDVKYFKSFVFKKTTLESYFTLCPRGFGPSSFRMYEALGLGQVPVYISDEFWLPFKDKINWKDFAILIPQDEISYLKEILTDCLNNDYKKKKMNLMKIKDTLFTWEGCINYIVRKISDEN